MPKASPAIPTWEYPRIMKFWEELGKAIPRFPNDMTSLQQSERNARDIA